MLALSVISQAAKEDRSWFFASKSQGIFRFWATVAGSKNEAFHCPGLSLIGRTWYLQISIEEPNTESGLTRIWTTQRPFGWDWSKGKL
jgi:hypothetical protein